MKKFIIGLAITLSLVIIGAIILYQRSTNTYSRAEADTIAFVRERTNLNQVEDFHWYNGTETYLTVTGTNEEGQERIYIVQQAGGQITSFSAENTISEQEAVRMTREARDSVKILNARIGMIDDTPVWEISYRNENDRLGYYIVNLQTGEWLRTIDNI
ncbi:cell wall elongation regulator TseB-like domain-containing protein [Alkalibacterium pelagium]|uniref:Uncharacterized protein YpmB n=1 Tax=Alkalibacterium pelagium TaxID=426702 RepID=A0A1H7KX39_9LACT|nr:DUF5590 domain-containing protein [Alkalibacterium pelagium]GEN50662.1 hypothetical protein APE02nite_13270 [Alkalibacterium pelagium]SEK90665.1 Uncharacterized protein YpmB [Alkalibacterium pelagium]